MRVGIMFGLPMIVVIGLVGALFYWFVIRPRRA